MSRKEDSDLEKIHSAFSISKLLQENLINMFEIVHSNKKDFLLKLQNFVNLIDSCQRSNSNPLIYILIECIREIHSNADLDTSDLKNIITKFGNEIYNQNFNIKILLEKIEKLNKIVNEKN